MARSPESILKSIERFVGAAKDLYAKQLADDPSNFNAGRADAAEVIAEFVRANLADLAASA